MVVAYGGSSCFCHVSLGSATFDDVLVHASASSDEICLCVFGRGFAPKRRLIQWSRAGSNEFIDIDMAPAAAERGLDSVSQPPTPWASMSTIHPV
jgi:hypothetical protein